jgi:TorA maturation chaperone TorD
MEQNEIKANIAGMLAGLIARPDEGLISALNSGELARAVRPHVNMQGRAAGFLDAAYTLEGLSSAYDKIMGPASGGSLLPVESLFKLWCDDEEGGHPSNAARGLLMGDPAMHMIELYNRFGIEVPDEFSGQPDHLLLELDFLSILYERCTEEMVRRFVLDHLDWVPELLRRWLEMKAPEFYIGVAEAIDSFLEKEISGFRCKQEVRA